MEFLHPAMWHDHDIDFARWLHPAMRHVALESWQWIHQVAAPCNTCDTWYVPVIRGSGMTCHWIRPVAALCNVIRSSGMTCHWIRPNVRHIGILHFGFDFDHITAVDMSFCTSLRNFIQIGPPSGEKMTSCRFSRWQISAVLDFRDPIMGSLRSPCTTSDRSSIETIALNCLVFEKIAFFGILATDRQTDEQMDSTDALSRSRYRELRLDKQINVINQFRNFNIIQSHKTQKDSVVVSCQ